ncbi:hypothetical protein ACQ4M3_06560 [Leptolyngbya sp. AN03gr2]
MIYLDAATKVERSHSAASMLLSIAIIYVRVRDRLFCEAIAVSTS